jgi:hypothetical protein
MLGLTVQALECLPLSSVLLVDTLLLVPLHAQNAPLELMLLLLVKVCALTVLPVTTVQPQVFLLMLLASLVLTLILELLFALHAQPVPTLQQPHSQAAPSVLVVITKQVPLQPHAQSVRRALILQTPLAQIRAQVVQVLHAQQLAVHLLMFATTRLPVPHQYQLNSHRLRFLLKLPLPFQPSCLVDSLLLSQQ